MKRSKWILTVFVCAAAALPAAAEPHAITTAEIAVAVRQVGMEVSPWQIAMMSEAVASTPEPELRVQSIRPVAENRAIVRLQCARTSECVPFFVSLRLTSAAGISISAKPQPQASPSVSSAAPPASVMVRRGSVTTLDLDGDHVHISIPVISLENGSAGQSIRVTDKNHKQTWMAQVVKSGLVEARF